MGELINIVAVKQAYLKTMDSFKLASIKTSQIIILSKVKDG